MILIEDCDPDNPEARDLMAALSARLREITGASGEASFDVADLRGPGAAFVVARAADGHAVGCGAYRPLEPNAAELKRMYAAQPGLGVGAALLAGLEVRARNEGYEALRLETRRVNLGAVRFYTRSGYAPVASYGKYIGRPDAVCLGKQLF